MEVWNTHTQTSLDIGIESQFSIGTQALKGQFSMGI